MLNRNFSRLNAEQKRAVQHGSGPLLVVAGPGTGKTAVITHRLAFLVRRNRAKPSEILALTFTDKAAQEMRDRVDQLLAESYGDLWISTFHSFAERILRQEGLDIGLSPDFRVLDETQSWMLLRRNLDRLKLDYYRPLARPAKFLEALASHFARCKDQGISAEDYQRYGRKEKDRTERSRLQEIGRAYRVYQDLLLENNSLDFGDLINYCRELWRQRPAILAKYRELFRYLLVDEFQDTNLSQYELVKELAFPRHNLTLAGDANQAIYRFRGASWGNLQRFKKDFPRSKIVVLKENYRSGQKILDLAQRFLASDKSGQPAWLARLDQKLHSHRSQASRVESRCFKDSEQEALAVAQRIAGLMKKNRRASWLNFAILVRANSQAEPLERALEKSGIPFRFLARSGLYFKPVILDILAWMRLLDDYHESRAVWRVLNLPGWNLSQDEIARISRYSSRRSQSLFETLEHSSPDLGLSVRAQATIKKILSLIRQQTRSTTDKRTSEIVVSFLEASGYFKYLLRGQKREELDFIRQFLDRIQAFEASQRDARLKSFLEEFQLELEAGEAGPIEFNLDLGPDAVSILTVHGAKGLEFPYVFLVGLNDRQFPSAERKEPIEIPAGLARDALPPLDGHLAEERRLFYVALTRAQRAVFLSSGQKPSRFLLELEGAHRAPQLGVKPLVEASVGPTRVSLPRKDRVRQETLPSHFSFTQLKAFATCPLQYKFAHVFRIPVPGRPSFSFGQTLHRTLARFLAESAGHRLSWLKLKKIYDQEWIDDWYESVSQKEQYYRSGLRSLQKVFRDFSRQKPHLLWLDNRPALEKDFSLKIGPETFIGKIDRLDELPGKRVEIIDYKTGSPQKTLAPGDKKQLLIYQMAGQEALGLSPVKLTYHYLDDNSRVSFLGQSEDLAREKREILKAIQQIKRSDLKARPGWHCRFCDFKNICEFAKIS